MYWTKILLDMPEAADLISLEDGDFNVFGPLHERFVIFNIYTDYGNENETYCKIIELNNKYNLAIDKAWHNIALGYDTYPAIVMQQPTISTYTTPFDTERANKIEARGLKTP
eukprot:363576_1